MNAQTSSNSFPHALYLRSHIHTSKWTDGHFSSAPVPAEWSPCVQPITRARQPLSSLIGPQKRVHYSNWLSPTNAVCALNSECPSPDTDKLSMLGRGCLVCYGITTACVSFIDLNPKCMNEVIQQSRRIYHTIRARSQIYLTLSFTRACCDIKMFNSAILIRFLLVFHKTV